MTEQYEREEELYDPAEAEDYFADQEAERWEKLFDALYDLQDEHGVYNMDGRRIGSCCNCEDYPCCGH